MENRIKKFDDYDYMESYIEIQFYRFVQAFVQGTGSKILNYYLSWNNY